VGDAAACQPWGRGTLSLVPEYLVCRVCRVPEDLVLVAPPHQVPAGCHHHRQEGEEGRR
jgi:hypothetical protein